MTDHGHDPTDPRAVRDRHYERVQSFREATRREVQERKSEIDALRAQRRDLRLSAATTAGTIGLRYNPETNTFVRLVGAMPEEVVVPDAVARPEPMAPEPRSTQEPAKLKDGPADPADRKESRWGVVLEVVVWLLLIVPAFFVGMGLFTIAGFNYRTDTWVLTVSPLLGFSVLAGLKILVSNLWRLVAHAQALGHPYWGRLPVAAAVTLGGCLLDAHLGAMALRQYLVNRAFTESSVPPYPQLFLLALAITCPLILASAALTYIKGLKEPSREDRERARAERAQARLEAEEAERRAKAESEKAAHRTALAAKIEAEYGDQRDSAAAKYAALRALDDQRSEDWATLKSNAEFKCLQGLIGQIDVLSTEISEQERDLTNFKIARGFEKADEFPNGKPNVASADGPPVQSAEEAPQGEAYAS
ncbi:MAG: hypothetical protein JST30_14570 [Armatimonadetes bacterium]|nr:hypothetical protein [Armatimonadota bacterium]